MTGTASSTVSDDPKSRSSRRSKERDSDPSSQAARGIATALHRSKAPEELRIPRGTECASGASERFAYPRTMGHGRRVLPYENTTFEATRVPTFPYASESKNGHHSQPRLTAPAWIWSWGLAGWSVWNRKPLFAKEQGKR